MCLISFGAKAEVSWQPLKECTCRGSWSQRGGQILLMHFQSVRRLSSHSVVNLCLKCELYGQRLHLLRKSAWIKRTKSRFGCLGTLSLMCVFREIVCQKLRVAKILIRISETERIYTDYSWPSLCLITDIFLLTSQTPRNDLVSELTENWLLLMSVRSDFQNW